MSEKNVTTNQGNTPKIKDLPKVKGKTAESKITVKTNETLKSSANAVKTVAKEAVVKKVVESKLAGFILDECERQSSDTIIINAKKTSEEIGAGRASVYRALSSLQDSGLIIFTKKQIQIINKSGLERM